MYTDYKDKEFRKLLLERVRIVLNPRKTPAEISMYADERSTKVTGFSEPSAAKALIPEEGVPIPDIVDLTPSVAAAYFAHDNGKTASLQIFVGVPDEDAARLGTRIVSVDQIPAVRGTMNRLLRTA